MGLLIECDECEGTGKVKDEHGKEVVCPNCEGEPSRELFNWSWRWI